MHKRITIVGLGNMGSSIVKGLNRSSLAEHYEIFLYDQHEERAESLAKEFGYKVLRDVASLSEPGMVIFCIKPHDLQGLSEIMTKSVHSESLLVSILAGTKIETIESLFSFDGGVVRAMPNIAATVGQAATALCYNTQCTPVQKDTVELVFKAIGEAYWTKESLLDTVTGLSGSGPAYIYMVIEAMTDGGVKMGLPRGLARGLATQTVLGAATLVKSTGSHPAVLKDQVTTPAGTTISALHELEERGLRSMFVSAVEKATNRSKYLGSQS